MSDLWDKEFIEREDVEELRKTEEGRHTILCWFMREWITHGLAKVFHALELEVPDSEKQELACSIMWDSIMRTPIWQIIEDKKLAIKLNKAGLKPIAEGDLFKMRPKGEA